jgi:electron-transferring-flavoprotein dehydrogenase
MIHFRQPIEGIERPQMEADVVIIGGGPAGMACALRLAQLIDAYNDQLALKGSTAPPLSKENIYVLEKSREAGQHCLSGGLLDPRSMRELLPGFESEAPIDAEVSEESVYFLTEKGEYKSPIVPPPMRDHGNYVISINKFVKWMAAKVEETGITIFTGFAGSELLFDPEGSGVTGVRTDDKGVDKQGNPKANFEPGYDLHSKITILAEGARGSCSKQLIERFHLEDPEHAQTYGVGIKELWEIPAGRVAKGEVIYTLGYPLTMEEYGGAWIYGISDTLCSVGYVVGLDYQDPRLDPHHVFQSFKEHPLARRLLEGGKMVRYGAKTLPYGGWLTMPKLAGKGWMILGDSASFLNSQRLKGIHLAIKSGMLAAETAFESLRTGNYSSDILEGYKSRVDGSWIREELYPVRNFHQGFEHGLFPGLMHAGIQQVLGGRNIGPDFKNHAGYSNMRHLDSIGRSTYGREATLGPAKADGKLTFDKLTDVYHSGTRHDDDQPVHLVIRDTDICNHRCVEEFGNPCQHFCPAAVYEMVEAPSEEPAGKQIHINFANCVHCKTCDVMDPYQVITWVPPEGGGGPNYDGM